MGVILFRLTENSILMNDISENTLNEELNKLFLVKIQFRENYTRLSAQRELESRRRQLLEANEWADQAQHERIHLCGRLEMKNCLHQESDARSCREIEELKRRCHQKEKLENNEDWRNFLRSMIRNHEQ